MASPVSPVAEPESVTILTGTAITAEINLLGRELHGIQMPAAWTAANLTFQVTTALGGTMQDAYNVSGTEITVTAAAARYIPITSGLLRGAVALKIRSGPSSLPVVQAADRALVLMLGEPERR